jgi:ribosome-binding protein aMBF1 (putative translation factor)
MSPEQCRAARAWIGWSQQDLAKRAKVGLSTVKDFENHSRTPIANNLAAMQSALETGGIRMTFGPKDGPLGIEMGAEKPKGAD